MTNPSRTINFAAQPGPQKKLLLCPYSDVLFGGARGGGKTYGSIGHFASKAHLAATVYNLEASFDGVFVRQTYPELEQLILEAKKVFHGLAEYQAGARKFVFPLSGPCRGATLQFQHLEHAKDTDKFQGKEFQWMCIEEAGQFPIPDHIDRIRATLRSSKGAPTFFLMTANPGGAGHAWLKARYVSPSPPNRVFDVEHDFDGEIFTTQRIFIQSLLSDNLLLTELDPDYKKRILVSTGGNQGLAKAWLYGSWDALAGGYFDNWNPKFHVLAPFDIPSSWRVYRSYDWGAAAPYSIGWHAWTTDEAATMADGTKRTFPKGSVIRVSEIYGAKAGTDEGLRGLEIDTIRAVQEREKLFKFQVSEGGAADLNIFASHNGKTLETEWRDAGIRWSKAEKEAGSRIHGWNLMRTMLSSALQPQPQENAGLYVFDTCRDFIRTIVLMQIDSQKPEDLNTSGPDHAMDECRYAILNKPPAPVRFGRIQGF